MPEGDRMELTGRKAPRWLHILQGTLAAPCGMANAR